MKRAQGFSRNLSQLLDRKREDLLESTSVEEENLAKLLKVQGLVSVKIT